MKRSATIYIAISILLACCATLGAVQADITGSKERCPAFKDLLQGHQEGRWVVRGRNGVISSINTLTKLATDRRYQWKRASTPSVRDSKAPIPENPNIGPAIEPTSIQCIYEKHLSLDELPTQNRLKGVTGGTRIIRIDFPSSRRPLIDLTWQNNGWQLSHGAMVADIAPAHQTDPPKAYRHYFLALFCTESREACWFKTQD